MQIKVWNGKIELFDKICYNFLFSILFLIIFLFEAVKTSFLPILRKSAPVLLKSIFFEKSKMAAKLADMLWNGCCHSNSS